MAKPELGTKRVCPETGRKFYDLNKDPIVSPYTGKSYPLSFFEDTTSEVVEVKAKEEPAESQADDEEDEVAETADVVSLEDAEEGDATDDKNLPDLGDNTDDEVLTDDDDDDTFLPDNDEDDDDDVSDMVDISADDED